MTRAQAVCLFGLAIDSPIGAEFEFEPADNYGHIPAIVKLDGAVIGRYKLLKQGGLQAQNGLPARVKPLAVADTA